MVSDSHMRGSKSIVNLLGEMSSENYLGEANTNNDHSDKIQGTFFYINIVKSAICLVPLTNPLNLVIKIGLSYDLQNQYLNSFYIL